MTHGNMVKLLCGIYDEYLQDKRNERMLQALFDEKSPGDMRLLRAVEAPSMDGTCWWEMLDAVLTELGIHDCSETEDCRCREHYHEEFLTYPVVDDVSADRFMNSVLSKCLCAFERPAKRHK